jgi:hypothetical protein
MKSGKNNMFDLRHYVPILKWKRAEQGALKALREDQKKYITPLIQFVMPKSKPGKTIEDVITKFEQQLLQLPKKIIEAWGINPVFIDVSLLYTTSLKAESIKSILMTGYKLGGFFIPVIYLNDDQKIKDIACSLAKKTKSGICLRLISPDFSDLTKLNRDIDNLISSNTLMVKDIDLLVDIKEIEDNNGNKYIKYFELSQGISNLTKWRTFIFASGSFPKNLSQCKIDEENLIPRIDWKSWKEKINSKKIKRKPSFADYTIQYPIYEEVSQIFHPTSSIKYTLKDDWLIMKGQRQKFEHYLAHAALLVEDKRYYGENFSDGDKYIAEKANHFAVYREKPSIKGTGSTETWLRAGINHHLVLTAHQIANLF